MADGGRATGPKDRRRGILRIGSDGVLPGADCCSDPAVNAVTQTLEATARQAAGEVDRRGESSDGEGVALATGMSPLGLGGDAGGSVRIPALFGGVTGPSVTYLRIHFQAVSWNQITPLEEKHHLGFRDHRLASSGR